MCETIKQLSQPEVTQPKEQDSPTGGALIVEILSLLVNSLSLKQSSLLVKTSEMRDNADRQQAYLASLRTDPALQYKQISSGEQTDIDNTTIYNQQVDQRRANVQAVVTNEKQTAQVKMTETNAIADAVSQDTGLTSKFISWYVDCLQSVNHMSGR